MILGSADEFRPAFSQLPGEPTDQDTGFDRVAILGLIAARLLELSQDAAVPADDLPALLMDALAEAGVPDIDIRLVPDRDTLRIEISSALAEDGVMTLQVPALQMVAALILPDSATAPVAELRQDDGPAPAPQVTLDQPEGSVEPGTRDAPASDAGVANPVDAGHSAEDSSSDSMIDPTQMLAMAQGITQTMAALQARIEAQVLAETLPLVGDGLRTAARAGEAALTTTATLGTLLAGTLNALATSSESVAAVQDALQSVLDSAGLSGTGISVSLAANGRLSIGLATQRAASYLQELASDLAMAGLGAVGGGSGTVDATFSYDLGFFVNSSNTFRVETGSSREVSIDLSLSDVGLLPTLSLGGQGYGVQDAGSGFTGTIEIDLEASAGTLRPNQITSATVDARLTGTAMLGVELSLASQGAMTPPISATLGVDWDFNDAVVTPVGSNAGFGERPSVAFDSVSMDLGSFMEGFIGPLVEKLDEMLAPIRPVINVLTASIRVLEKLPGPLRNLVDVDNNDRVNLLDLLQVLTPSVNLSGFNKLVEIAEQVTAWADFLASTDFASGNLSLGGFDFGNVDIRAPGFDLADVVPQFNGGGDGLASVLAGLGGAGWNTTDGGSGMTGRAILQSIVNDPVFNLPILTGPDQWMQMFLGRVANLVTIDLPEIVIGTESTPLTQPLTGIPLLPKIPIFPPVFLTTTFGLQANIDLGFGFDTRGLLDPNLQAIDGFHILDNPASADVVLRAMLGMGVSLNALVADLTASGGIEGTILMNLNSAIGSTPGKIYLDEFGAAFAANPFSIFNASGSITAGLTISLSTILTGKIWQWSSPRVLVGDFGFDDIQSDPNLADRSGSTLSLNVGADAGDRAFWAQPFDGPETVVISKGVKTNETIVSINGITESFTATILRVEGAARNGPNSMILSTGMLMTADFTGGKDDDWLEGGDLNDTLSGGGGEDFIVGGLGNDSLRGDGHDDFITGGDGADTIDGGTGSDWAIYIDSDAGVNIDLLRLEQFGGHAQGDHLILIENVEGSGFDDSITGGLVGGVLIGGGGDDTMTGGSGRQVLLGNDGDDLLTGFARDTLSGGEGDDIYIVNAASVVINENWFGEIEDGSDSGYDWVQAWASVDLSATDNHVERITLFGTARDAAANNIANLIEGNNQRNNLAGLGGNDTILAGGGRDTVSGGDGNDWLFGQGGPDSMLGGAGNDTIWSGSGDDTLVGNAGADRLIGNTGNDYYIVDAADRVFELPTQGVDFIWATESFALAPDAAVEVLSLMDMRNLPWVVTSLLPSGPAVFYGLATLSAGRSSNRDASLTGNGFSQYLIADIADIEQPNFANILEGLGGADTIVGDFRKDFAAYVQSPDAVLIDLSAASQTGGHAQGDVLHGINHLIGSDHNDTLLGQFDPASAILSFVDNEFLGGAGNDLLSGFGGFDTLHGEGGNDLLFGGADHDEVFGGAGNDTLFGGDGDDTLDGGSGADFLGGGDGDDLFLVRLGDTVEDTGGYDTVVTLTDYILPGGVEIEVLQAAEGASGLILIGNEFDQTIIGDAGNSTIHGGGSGDFIFGGAGGRNMVVYSLSGLGVDVDLTRSLLAGQIGGHAEGDRLVGITDLRGSLHSDVLAGDEQGNFLEGLAGADTLHGGAGADELLGGQGDDALFGDDGADTLTGGDGNDTLNGGAGADQMAGGSGDDVYVINSAGDVIVELADQGRDTVRSTITTELGDNLEDLVLLGSTRINGAGNTMDNAIRGNAGNNILQGREGADTLTGGAGSDIFVFNTPLDSSNVDVITDFEVGVDRIRLHAAQFEGLVAGDLDASAFRAAAAGAAATAAHRILYSTTTGNLFHDADGTGAAPRTLVAVLQPGLALTHQDFFVV